MNKIEVIERAKELEELKLVFLKRKAEVPSRINKELSNLRNTWNNNTQWTFIHTGGEANEII